jgi:hypothetical protein
VIDVKMPGLSSGQTGGSDIGGGYSGYFVPVHTWTSTSDVQQASVDDLFEALDELNDVYSGTTGYPSHNEAQVP